ncbi:MAG: hypothetical protein ABSB76_22750 [Streptosporangiaceae bacterium]
MRRSQEVGKAVEAADEVKQSVPFRVGLTARRGQRFRCLPGGVSLSRLAQPVMARVWMIEGLPVEYFDPVAQIVETGG